MLRQSDGYLSGQQLCDHFQVSRTAVWKAINQLKEEGIDKKDFLDAYRKFKNVVGTKSEEKQLDKAFEEVSGYSIYKVFKASQEKDWIKM